MSNFKKIYKCDQCDLIVEALRDSDLPPFCCEKEMKLLEEQVEEMGSEKHRPVIEGDRVKIGEVPHPMEEKHYIEWVQVDSAGGLCRKFFKPGDSPEAKFCSKDIRRARIYCNIHGLWKS